MAYDYNRQARSSIVPDKVKKDIKKAHALLAELVETYDRLQASADIAETDLAKKQVAAQVALEMGKKRDGGPSAHELERAVYLLRDVLRLNHYSTRTNQMDLESLVGHVKDMQRL